MPEKRATKQMLSAYITGFILSLLLTLAAYLVVVREVVALKLVVPIIVGLAIVQLFVQLTFFLHLGREPKPRWNLMAFLFMVSVVFIVVAGSLWIMANLDYNMTHRTDSYLLQQKDKGF